MKRTIGITLALILTGLSALSNRADAQISKRESVVQAASVEQTIRLLNQIRSAEKGAGFAVSSSDVLLPKSSDTSRFAKTHAHVLGGGTITGKLFNLASDDPTVASVTAWPVDSSANGTATAYFGSVDPDGNYIIDVAEAGKYYVVARADGYAPLFYDNAFDLSQATPIAVLEGDLIEGVDFRMQPISAGSASITGLVTDDESGAPVPNAFITFISPDNLILYASVQTGADGRYAIKGLRSGTYYASVWANGYLSEFYDDVETFDTATPIVVEEPATTENIDFGLSRGGIISGIVTDDSGAPVSGVYVQAYTSSVFWIGPDGQMGGGMGGMDDGSGGGMNGDPGGMLDPDGNGQVTDTTGTGSGDASGGSIEPVFPGQGGGFVVPGFPGDPGFPADSSNVIFGFGSAVTDNTGHFSISGLPAGNYLVLAQAWGPWYAVTEWYDDAPSPDLATPVAVEVGQEASGIDFSLPVPNDFGAITGAVTDAGGVPLEGVFVQAQSPFERTDGSVNAWGYAYTDRNGKYRIDKLPEGSYLVSAWVSIGWQYVQRYWPDAENPDGAMPVVVTADPGSPVDFVLPLLPDRSSISGQVLRNTGEPLVNAYVQVSSADAATNTAPNTAAGNLWASAMTDSTGRFRVDRLPEGKYVAQAQYWEFDTFAEQWFDHADARIDATVIDLSLGEQRDDVNFDLTPHPRFGSIGGTVVSDRSGLPIRRAYVEVAPIGVEYRMAPFAFWSHYAITDDAGSFKIDWLFEGEYVVQVYADGAHEYYDNVQTSGEATPVKVTGGEASIIKVGLTKRNEGTGAVSGRVMHEWDDGIPEIAIVTARPAVRPDMSSTDGTNSDAGSFFNTVTSERGTYTLAGLPAGQYYLYSFAPEHIGEYYKDAFVPEDATVVTVDVDKTTPDIDFTLTPVYYLDVPVGDLMGPNGAMGPQGGAMIYGAVTDDNGRAIGEADIYLLNEAGEPVSFARSNAEGMYELSGVPPGRYMVQVSHLDYESVFYDNSLPGGGTSGTVIDLSGGLLQINFALDPATTTTVEDPVEIPDSIELYGNYPNPFNPQTRISFSLPAEMEVRVRIFNLLGQQVRLIDAGRRAPGAESVVWDGRDESNQSLPSGIYLYVLEADGRAAAHSSMVLLR